MCKAKENEERIRQEIEVVEQARREKSVKESAELMRNILRPRYEDCTLENFVITSAPHEKEASKNERKKLDVLTKLRKFGEDIVALTRQGQGIVLTGPEGTGKDHLMSAMLRVAAAQGLSINRVDGMSLYTSFKDVVIRAGKPAEKFIADLCNVDILAISDPVPFRGHASDFDIGLLQQIVNRRYCDKRPTWMTLNASSSAEAQEMLTAPVVARLRHDSATIKCDWPSYRKPGEQWL